MFSFFSKGQSELDIRFSEANAELNLRNMYQRIIWGMYSVNKYVFDQTKGAIKYTIRDNGNEVIAKPKILGTFNLDNKTFLWADKNPSIDAKLNDKVNSFRATLPKKYQRNKFKSNIDFNINLLSLFSYHLDANGLDMVRQNNTIIYFSLLEIQVIKDDKELLIIEPKNHVQVTQNQNLINLIKEFHQEKLEVNKIYNERKLESNEAFKEIENIHLKYWLNEDPYFFPALSWPCYFDEKSILDWKIFKIGDNRIFVMYTTDIGWKKQSYAYEIDIHAEGKKVIINQY